MWEIILWHRQTSTCVTTPWDAGSVWHVIKRSLAGGTRSASINCCTHSPHDSDFSASRWCPREPRLTVFLYNNSIPGYLKDTAKEVKGTRCSKTNCPQSVTIKYMHICVCVCVWANAHEMRESLWQLLFAGNLGLSSSIASQFTLLQWKIAKKSLNTSILRVQGHSKLSMLKFLKSSSPVLVMISSMSAPICNHFHARQGYSG